MFLTTMIMAFVVVVTFTCMLALMREVVLVRGELTAISQAITKPLAQLRVGQQLDPSAASHPLLREQLARSNEVAENVAVTFLTSQCSTCLDFAARLSQGKRNSYSKHHVVVVAAPEEQLPSFAAQIQSSGIPVLADPEKTIFAAVGVTGTPASIILSPQERVIDYVSGGTPEWVEERRRSAAQTETSSAA